VCNAATVEFRQQAQQDRPQLYGGQAEDEMISGAAIPLLAAWRTARRYSSYLVGLVV
jgi:hypothetical protein